MNRDDLRVWVATTINETRQERHDHYRPVSDAELAEMGYVKLEGQWDKWDDAWATKNGYIKAKGGEGSK